MTVVEDNLERWDRNYRTRYHYTRSKNWKRVVELQKRGRSGNVSPHLRYRIARAVFLVKTTMWVVGLLTFAVLAKLGGVGG
jgi:hypothetical protein